MLEAVEPMLVYRVLDGKGSAIGQVRQPRSGLVLGREAGTVLLVRQDNRASQMEPGSATAA